ncbi:Mitochondrial GTPase 1 [Pleosporales sp. CAS-2024a]
MVILFFAVLFFALALVANAKTPYRRGDMLQVYTWPSNDCQEYPIKGNIELPRNHCVNIRGRSVRPTLDFKRQHWLNWVRLGKHTCVMAVYTRENCGGEESLMELPKDLDKCFTTKDLVDVGSLMFYCGPALKDATVTTTKTTHHTQTIWSLGTDDAVTPVTRDATFVTTMLSTKRIQRMALPTPSAAAAAAAAADAGVNVVVSPLPSPHPVTVTVTSIDLYSPELSSMTNGLEVRENGGKLYDGNVEHLINLVYVWMKHPWAESPICYLCGTKRNFWGWARCAAKPNYIERCGEADFHPLTTATETVTESLIATTPLVVATQTVVLPAAMGMGMGTMRIAPRQSWHRSVRFTSPWDPNKGYCAEAEWEFRGKTFNVIKLKNLHFARGGNTCDHLKSLDVPTQEAIKFETKTVTRMGYTAVETRTETVYQAPVFTTFSAHPTKTFWLPAPPDMN